MKDRIKMEEHDNTGKKVLNSGKKEFKINEIKIPVYVGGYNISGDKVYKYRFNYTKKPSWFHRFSTRLLLGWIWEDEK